MPAAEVQALDHGPDPAARVAYGSARLAIDSLDTVDFTDLRCVLVPEPVCRYAQAVRQALAAGCPVAAMEPELAFDTAGFGSQLTLVAPAPALIMERLVRAAEPVAAITAADAMVLEPASAGGQASVQRLARECAEVLNARTPEPANGDVVRAFNAVAAGGGPRDVLGVPVRLTNVAMPVFFGEALVCHLSFQETVDPEALQRALATDAAITVHGPDQVSGARDGIDSEGLDVTVFSEVASDGQRLWAVGDNLRLQAAALMAGATE